MGWTSVSPWKQENKIWQTCQVLHLTEIHHIPSTHIVAIGDDMISQSYSNPSTLKCGIQSHPCILFFFRSHLHKENSDTFTGESIVIYDSMLSMLQ